MVTKIAPSLTAWLGVILILSVIWLRVPIYQSLWLDETVTLWITSASFTETLNRSWSFQAQSPLYFLLFWLWRSLLVVNITNNELLYRLPSVIAMALAIVILIRIVKNYEKEAIASIIILVCLADPTLIKLSIGARPYSIAFLSLLGSIWALNIWLSSGTNWWRLIYIVFTTLTFYFHYVFALVGILHLIIFLTRKSTISITTTKLFFTWVCCLILALPGVLHILSWSTRSNLLALYPAVTLVNFSKNIFPVELTVFGLCGSALMYLYSTPSLKRFPAKNLLLVSLIWAFLPTTILFLISKITGNQFFLDRFYFWRIGGMALGVSALVSLIKPRTALNIMLVVWIGFSLLLESMRIWQIENWANVANTINNETEPKTGVLLYSGLVELGVIDWTEGSLKEQYLGSPFKVYPVKFPFHILPHGFEENDSTTYWQQRLIPKLSNYDRLALVTMGWRNIETKDNNHLSVQEYFKNFLTTNNWEVIENNISDKQVVKLMWFKRVVE
jgi:uncharacterized membrane protein